MKNIDKQCPPATMGIFYNYSRHHHTTKKQKRKFDRKRLLDAKSYYDQQFPKVKINGKREWTVVRCCFHSPDNRPSLNINVVRGCFKCFSCGAKGGDIVAFHRQRYRLSFAEALCALNVWED